MIRDFYLHNAEMSLILDPSTMEHRMILLSDCHSVSVCIERKSNFSAAPIVLPNPSKVFAESRKLSPCNVSVPSSFFDKVSSGDLADIDSNYQAWFVQYELDGLTIVNQNVGLGFLGQYHEDGMY